MLTLLIIDKNYFCRLILLFNLFLLLFIDPITFFGIIYKSYGSISINLNLPLFTMLSAKKFQFQQNKRILNWHYMWAILITHYTILYVKILAVPLGFSAWVLTLA